MILKDKVIIISGIGPGLGQALSTLAAQEGASVVMACRTRAKLDAAEAEIAALGLGTPVLKQVTDIADADQCRALAQAAEERFGRIDGLVNSAYVGGRNGSLEEADLDDWRRTMDVNLFGTINLSRAVLRVMKAQGGGSIVNINTMATRKPFPGLGGYAASKAAAAATTALMAREWGRYGVRVNTVAMGWMWGASVEEVMVKAAASGGPSVEAQRAEVAKGIALGRITTDRECAKMVMTVLSDHSSAMSGAAIDVNGGEFMPML